MNPRTPFEMRMKTQQILVNKYYFWTRKQVRIFKKSSFKYRRHANLLMEAEMFQYALIGLMKSIMRYNGTVYFHQFAKKYVYGELYRGVVERIPMQPLKRWQFYSRNATISRVPKITLISDTEDEWLYDKEQKNSNSDPLEFYSMNISGKKYVLDKKQWIEKINEIIEKALPEQRRLFLARYDPITFEPIRTVYYASKLMAFSDETYRKKMNVLKKYIIYQLNKNVLRL
jgi:DNA-directed RNA polymerase specialized sigma subunit